MGNWRRKNPRMDRITNEKIKRRMGMENYTLNYIEENRWTWSEHVRRVDSNKWIAKLTEWSPIEMTKKIIGRWSRRQLWKPFITYIFYFSLEFETPSCWNILCFMWFLIVWRWNIFEIFLKIYDVFLFVAHVLMGFFFS